MNATPRNNNILLFKEKQTQKTKSYKKLTINRDKNVNVLYNETQNKVLS